MQGEPSPLDRNMPYKLVIFDFDGTLADSFPWFLSVFNDVADRFEFKRIAEDEVEAVRGLGSREILTHFGVPLWKVPRIAAYMRRLAANDAAAIPLFDGVDRLLESLAVKGVATAIVSSNAKANIRRILGSRNAALITHYACGASLFGKAAKLRRLMRKSGLAPGEVILVGDEVRDGEATKAEKIAFGAVSWGYARPDALLKQAPAAVFADFDDLVAKVA
jgi:phosphoglycolate phosphatase